MKRMLTLVTLIVTLWASQALADTPGCQGQTGRDGTCLVLASSPRQQETALVSNNAKREQLLKLLMIMHGVSQQGRR